MKRCPCCNLMYYSRLTTRSVIREGVFICQLCGVEEKEGRSNIRWAVDYEKPNPLFVRYIEALQNYLNSIDKDIDEENTKQIRKTYRDMKDKRFVKHVVLEKKNNRIKPIAEYTDYNLALAVVWGRHEGKGIKDGKGGWKTEDGANITIAYL